MKISLNTFYLAVVIVIFTASSCDNNNDDVTISTSELTDYDWKVLSRTIDGTATYPPNDYILTFVIVQENDCHLLILTLP